MKTAISKGTEFYRKRNLNAWIIFYFLIYVILLIKLITIRELDDSFLFGAYSVAVSFYILSRFALAYFYDPHPSAFSKKYLPKITFGIPAKNEGQNIRETILRIAESDYPKDKITIIAVNDGSTDNTLLQMLSAKRAAKRKGIPVTVVNWRANRGKREGMAECVRRSEGDIVIFIDSDSFVEPTTAKELVKYFSDPIVGAVAGHAYVANAEDNMLTKMQAVRYYVAFKAYKRAEALFGAVTCCSGCCSAYRRSAVDPILDEWLNQTFLGVRCTYGDDRSLTNFLLKRGYKTLFAPDALSYTFVPNTLKTFMRQQLRWKKSWTRESLKAGLFMWKKNPIMSISFYLGVALPLISPVIVARALIWQPLASGRWPFYYILGLLIMAAVYGLYYYIHVNDRKWVYGVLFATFYTLVLIWQLPYAILNIRDPSWGTR